MALDLFPENQAPSFSSLNSVCAEAQQVICLLIGGSMSCLFISWRSQDVQLLLNSGVIKFTSSPYWLQLASSRLLLESSGVQFWAFTHAHTYSYLLPVHVSPVFCSDCRCLTLLLCDSILGPTTNRNRNSCFKGIFFFLRLIISIMYVGFA